MNNAIDPIAEEISERLTILMRQDLTHEQALREQESMVFFRKAKLAEVAPILSSLKLIRQTELDFQIREMKDLGFSETRWGAVILYRRGRECGWWSLSKAQWAALYVASVNFNESQRRSGALPPIDAAQKVFMMKMVDELRDFVSEEIDEGNHRRYGDHHDFLKACVGAYCEHKDLNE